jgi:hypothetical protein
VEAVPNVAETTCSSRMPASTLPVLRRVVLVSTRGLLAEGLSDAAEASGRGGSLLRRHKGTRRGIANHDDDVVPDVRDRAELLDGAGRRKKTERQVRDAGQEVHTYAAGRQQPPGVVLRQITGSFWESSRLPREVHERHFPCWISSSPCFIPRKPPLKPCGTARTSNGAADSYSYLYLQDTLSVTHVISFTFRARRYDERGRYQYAKIRSVENIFN